MFSAATVLCSNTAQSVAEMETAPPQAEITVAIVLFITVAQILCTFDLSRSLSIGRPDEPYCCSPEEHGTITCYIL